MNREIIFRGKDAYTGEWVYGDLLQNGRNYKCAIRRKGGAGELRANVRVRPETVGQYIGLTDKNGIKIFDGDLVKISIKDTRLSKYALVGIGECEDGYGYKCVSAYLRWGGANMLFYTEYASHLEVIGNIHDNFEQAEEANDI